MPAHTFRAAIVPLLVIAMGVGWLLTNLKIIPEVNWFWTGGLAVIGLLTFVLSGIDRFSIVVGPFLLIASLASVLRQTGRLSTEVEVPALFIVLGVLWFLAVLLPLPNPKWMLPPLKSK